MAYKGTRLWDRLGPRGLCLLSWAWVDSMFGIGMLAAPGQIRAAPAYSFPGKLLPVPLWGAIWLLTAVVLIFFAFRQKDSPGFAVAIAIKLFWGILMAGGWLTGEIPRGYVSMGWWVGAAVVVAVCSRYLPLRVAGEAD